MNKRYSINGRGFMLLYTNDMKSGVFTPVLAAAMITFMCSFNTEIFERISDRFDDIDVKSPKLFMLLNDELKDEIWLSYLLIVE